MNTLKPSRKSLVLSTVWIPIILVCLYFPAGLQTVLAEQWNWKVIDGLSENDNGVSPSVGLNRQGNITVAYYAGTLKYATYASNGWVTETVDGGSQHGIYPALAYDSQGIPHITYEAYPNFYYATRNPITELWAIEYVSPYGVFSDLVFGLADQPHASYVGWSSSNDLFYATKIDETWFTEVVDDSGIFYYNSTGIAIDSQAVPHIVYSAVGDTTSEVRHAFQDSLGWHIETIVSGMGVGRGPDICIDQNDNLHVSVFDDNNENLLYVMKNSDTWSVSVIDEAVKSEGHDWHARTAIALMPGDVPVVAYFDDLKDELRFARKTGSTWDIQLVDNAGRVGETPSMVISNHGIPFIAYHDDGRDMFKLAYPIICQYVLHGDLNDDCRVDLLDFAIMAENWLVDCILNPNNPACIPK